MDDLLSFDLGTGLEAQLHQQFVLLDVVSNDSLLRRHCEELGHIEHAKALDVDGTTRLIDSVVTVRIVLLHSLALIILVCVNDVVYSLFFSPVHKVSEHELHFGKVKLSRASEAKQIMVIKVKLF